MDREKDRCANTYHYPLQGNGASYKSLQSLLAAGSHFSEKAVKLCCSLAGNCSKVGDVLRESVKSDFPGGKFFIKALEDPSSLVGRRG